MGGMGQSRVLGEQLGVETQSVVEMFFWPPQARNALFNIPGSARQKISHPSMLSILREDGHRRFLKRVQPVVARERGGKAATIIIVYYASLNACFDTHSHSLSSVSLFLRIRFTHRCNGNRIG